jgi:hypothetical protein
MNLEHVIVLDDPNTHEVVNSILLNPGYLVCALQTKFDWMTVFAEGRNWEGKCEPWEDPRKVAIKFADDLPDEEKSSVWEIVSSVRTALDTIPSGNIQEMGGVEGLVKAFAIVEALKGYQKYGHKQSPWREFFPAKQHSKSAPVPVNQYTIGDEFEALDFKPVEYVIRTPLAGGLCAETFYADTVIGADWRFAKKNGKIFPPSGTRIVVSTTTGQRTVTRAYKII